MITLFHTADLHAKPTKADEVLSSLQKLSTDAEDVQPDLIAIPGDIWDGSINNSEKAFFPVFVEAIRELADIAPVVMVYGTPSHDIPGSLDIFRTLNTRFGITILQPGLPYFLCEKQDEVFISQRQNGFAKGLIFGVPEPGKEWLNASEEQASEEAREENLKKLFLGLGTIRQQYSEIPCILLYHGQVRGARLQNTQRLESGVSIDDLRAVGADYIALGDIHEPQKVGDLEAYYPGSAYPGNFGETHQAGYNRVTINTGSPDPDLFVNSCCDVKVERIDYPHPQRCHHIVSLNEFDNTNWPARISGKVAWIEIKDHREALSDLNPEYMTSEVVIRDYGALSGSKVTLTPLPVETVRASEITEKKTLRDKVIVYADASEQDVSDDILKLADQLEEEGRATGETGVELNIELQKLILRGAIGIWKGQKKDDVCLDFTQYDSGLIALIGVNGAGKTTLIENMHPWPQLLTRDGKLQDHFRLRDSYRDLYFRDAQTGIEYRSLLKIDGKNASGSVEYYMYQNVGGEWQPLTGINGRKEPYMESIIKLWGSRSLYLLSAFSTQRPSKSAPDLASAARGEKRALFAELSGVDYLQGYADIAKEKAKAIDSEILTKSGQITAIEQQVAKLPEIEESVRTGMNLIADTQGKLKESQKEKQIADANLRAIEEQRQTQIKIKTDMDSRRERGDQIHDSITIAKEEQQLYSDALNGKENAEATVKEWEVLDNERKQLEEQRRNYNDEYQRKYSEWSDGNKAHRDSRQKILDEIQTMEKAKSALEADRKVLAAENDRLEEEIRNPIDQNCPTCGQVWPEDKLVEYRKAMDQKEDEADLQAEKLVRLHQDITKIDDTLIELQQKLTDLGEGTPEPEKADFPGREKSNDIEMKIEFIDIEAARNTLEKAREAQVRMDETEKRIQQFTEEQQRLESEYLELERQYNPEIEDKYTAAKKRCDDLQIDIHKLDTSITENETRLEEYKKQVTELKKLQSEITNLKTEIAVSRELQNQWKFLQLACGRDGIQALELDAVAPNICEIANRLLSAAYGSRFQIEIRTTRMSGTGSKIKQVEDFDIWIIDTENMDEQTLDTLSGGEVVWIRKALYDAFGIVRTRNTGMNFLTVFLDEADGALDPEAREHYFRMLEAAHAESGRRHTVLITHSREIQEIIRQRIDICDLAMPEKMKAAA